MAIAAPCLYHIEQIMLNHHANGPVIGIKVQ